MLARCVHIFMSEHIRYKVNIARFPIKSRPISAAKLMGRYFFKRNRNRGIFLNQVFYCTHSNPFSLKGKEKRFFVSFFRDDAFTFKHIIQKCGACFIPKYKNILIPTFANNRKSFAEKFMSSMLIPTSSLMRMPVPRKSVRIARSRFCVRTWYFFCFSVNPSPLCTTSSKMATSFGSRRIGFFADGGQVNKRRRVVFQLLFFTKILIKRTDR